MTVIIAVFGLLIAGLSVWGFIAPRRMIDTLLSFWNKPSGLYLAIGVRVVFGVLFILAASETKYPTLFEVFGYLMLVAAVAIPIVGKERLGKFIAWWTEIPAAGVRVWLVFGMIAGLFIFYGAI